MKEADFGGRAWNFVVVEVCHPMEDDCGEGYIGGTANKANLKVRKGVSQGGIQTPVHAPEEQRQR